MKAHSGFDAESELVHTLVTTAANVPDVTPAQNLLYSEYTDIFPDSGDRGVEKCEVPRDFQVNWNVAMMQGKRGESCLETAPGQLPNAAEKVKAGNWAKVEHPLRGIKCQFVFTKVRYRGLANSTAGLQTMFALSNLSVVR
jgi:IS5 family transposase